MYVIRGPPIRSVQILEGLHPFADERMRALFDFKIYLDISDEVKFAWKIQVPNSRGSGAAHYRLTGHPQP